MVRINVTTVQQYTIDCICVSLNGSYETELLQRLSFKLFKEDGTEITDRLKSIMESNGKEWQYVLETNSINIYLRENTQIENGIYTFVLIKNDEEIYRGNIPLAHMEDIRIEFDKVEAIDMETLHVTLKPINSSYQSVDMMKLLNFSIISSDQLDKTKSIRYNDVFQNFHEVVDFTEGNEIREFTLKVKPGKALPPGYYDVRLTSPYKSRTFEIVEKITIKLPFMTTTPAQITSVKVSQQAVTKQTVLSVVFNPFLEKGLMLSAKREIIRSRDSLNISGFFDASRVSTVSYTTAGISYITRIEIPLASDTYSLEKGKYTFRYSWPNSSTPIPPVEFEFEVGWVVKELQNISIKDGKYVDFDLWKDQATKDFLQNYHLLVELNGKEIDPDGIFGPLEQSAYIESGIDVLVSDHFGIRILDMSKIKDGTYSFLLWTVRSADPNGFEGDIYYNYIGNIDIVDYLTPRIKDVYQSNVDTLTVVLEKAQPIASLIQCELSLYDEYGRIDFSDRLIDIENSNIWEPGQTTAKQFDVVIREDKTLSSGRYQFNLKFREKESNSHFADIEHVESRRGYIEKIEQISINKVKITFSEPQSRQFLLTTNLRVRMGNDNGSAKWYEDRFEYLENVLKADQSQFKEFEIMMDHEDSLPAGRYQFIFEFDNGEYEISTLVYSYTVELGYMTNNIPAIKYINPTIIEEGEYAGRLGLEIYFKHDLELELYNTAMFSCIRESDGLDIESDFEGKEEWITIDDARLSENTYKTRITIPALDVEYAHIERGVYTVNFSWDGIIPYMEDIEKKVNLEYYLPRVKTVEVVDMDMTRKWGRIYFELNVTMQYSYYEHLKVEVLDPDGVDCTKFFDTVFNSNNIDPSLPDSQKLPSNSFNLDILQADKLGTGRYQFIFYTDYTGMRQSDWIARLDVRQSLHPKIINACQISLSQIEITLMEAIPRRLLEEMTISFSNANHTDHSDDFLTIDQANVWPEDLREVSTFVIELKGGKILKTGTYDFGLYNGNYLCDDYIFDIIWMEGAYGNIEYITPTKINSVQMKFKARESRDLFKTLSLVVEEFETGKDMRDHFGDTLKGLIEIETSYFDNINLPVTKPIPEGTYNFRWGRAYTEAHELKLPDNKIFLPFLSNIKPVLKSVTSTKKGDDMMGDDAIIMWFSPPLEITLYNSSTFGIRKTLNTDIDVTDHFKDISTAEIQTTTDDDGNTYVEFITLDYAKMVTLNRDRYTFIFQWRDELHMNYMDEISKEQNMNYILFPFRSVEQIDPETIKCTFKTPVKGGDMLQSEVWVYSDKSVETGDGLITEEVDFSNQFLPLNKTNKFEEDEEYAYVLVRMGTRDENDPAKAALPPNRYRFIISQAIEEEDIEDYGLIYVYGGSCDIEFLVNSEMLYSPFTLTQTLYDRLKYVWDKLQFIQMLNMFTFKITRVDPVTQKIIDYSSYFMDVYDANYYYLEAYENEDGTYTPLVPLDSKYNSMMKIDTSSNIKSNNEASEDKNQLPIKKNDPKKKWIEGWYFDKRDYVVIFDEVHYYLPQSPTAYVKLRQGYAIPANTYETSMIYRGNEYFKKEITLPFMTSTPPDIYDMYFEKDEFEEGKNWLVVKFSPYAEWESLSQSSFVISTYRGEFSDGSVKGEIKNENFGQIIDCEKVEPEKQDEEIRYVQYVRIPVIMGSILPSGRYKLTWTWPQYTFFDPCEYIGGLGLIGIGLESAKVVAKDTIEIVLKENTLSKDFKSLVLNVDGYHDGDVSDRFMLLSDSNSDIADDIRTKTYHIKLDDGEELSGDTYRFVLSQMVEEDDDDDEITEIAIETCIWEMTIVYMTTDFPHLDRLDNLSVARYEVDTITNYNAEDLVGRDIQELTSRDSSDIITFSQEDIKDYVGRMVKIYGIAAIDKLTAVFDEELDASLIHALEMEVYTEDGMDISDSFKLPRESNSIEYRNVLYGISINLNNYDLVQNIKSYGFYVQTADGREISGYFNSIEESNAFTSEESKVKSFNIIVHDDYTIEEYDIPDLIVRLADESNRPIERFKFEIQKQTIESIRLMNINLAPNTTICPGQYTFKFSYTNDPDIDVPVLLYPFAYTGNMPFLSNNLGEIAEVNVIDFEHIDLVFSEMSIPTNAFNNFELRLINEDGNEVDPNIFEPIMATNQFEDAETLEELEDPGVIHLQLQEGKTLASGTYRFQFWIDVATNESDGEGDPSDNDDEGDDNDDTEIDPAEVDFTHTGEYCLWDKYKRLPIMFREMSNMIKSVEIIDIERIKITLEKKLDISILRDFTVDLYDPLRDITRTGKFESVDKSNFFGLYIMTTNKSLIMYSEDGAYWDSFDTGYEYSYTKCFYHKPSKYFFALTGNGKIIKWNNFEKTAFEGSPAVEVVKYADKEVRTSLNDFVIINENIVIVGNSGTILRGTIDSYGNISLTNVNEDKKYTSYTLSAINYNDGVLLAVGYKGTIIKSTDMGATWVTLSSGVVYNLTDICYHKNTIEIEGELPEIDGEEELETDTPIPEKVIAETMDTSGYFICGNNGTILTCSNFEEGFGKIKVPTKKSFFSIMSHEDRIIAVGDAGNMVVIADTEDGYEPNVIEIPDCKFSLRDIAFCDKKFFVCGANGNWLFSKEGENWSVNGMFTDAAMRSVTYIPSQYDSDMADWFYLKVGYGQEIAPINYYSGWDEPTLESDFCVEWEENGELDDHIQDFYTQFEFSDNRPKPFKYYHFVKKATIVPLNGEDVDEVDNERRIDLEDVSYEWEECPGYEPAHNASFYVRLRDKNKYDVNSWLYSTDNPIQFPYMTSKDLQITGVELHSPDDEPSTEYYKPYLKINFNNVNENCFHYVRYAFVCGAEDHTDWFQSIRVADINYNWSLNVESINLFGANDLKLSDAEESEESSENDKIIKKGLYTLKWAWMAPGTAPDDEKYITINDIPVKNMLPFVDRVDSDDITNPTTAKIIFTKYIDSRFFLDTNGFDMVMGKIPNSRSEYEKLQNFSTNYYDYFKSVEDCTDFTEMDHIEEEIEEKGKKNQIIKVKEVFITLHDREVLKSGDYLLKINNTSSYKREKEDDDTVWVTCTDKGRLELEDEMTSNLPVIRDVTLERHISIPTRSDGQVAETFTGKSKSEADTLLQQWITDGTPDNHVGDQFLDESTDITYYLIRRKPYMQVVDDEEEEELPGDTNIIEEEEGEEEQRTGWDYEWWTPIEEPYLCISFESDKMPLYDTFVRRYAEFLFDEMEDSEPDEEGNITQTSIKDFRPWFRQTIEWFEYDFAYITDDEDEVLQYISKLYIPFVPDCPDFPGCDNGTFVLKFDKKCKYGDLVFTKIVLPTHVKSYGDIERIQPKNPSVKKSDPTAGFIIEFQKELSKQFVKSLDVKVTWILSENQKKKLDVKSNEIDVSYKFQSILNSNIDEFDDEKDSVNKVNLWLSDGNFIDHGKYRITLTGEVENDTLFDIEDVNPVVMKKTVTCPWLSTRIPEEIKSVLKVSGTSNPTLTVTFTDTKPPHSSIIKSKTNNVLNGKIIVKDHKTGKYYTTSFRPLANTTVKWAYDKNLAEQRKGESAEKWVTSITIPMCNNSALPKGTFDVSIRYHPKALLEDIPYPKEHGYCQFKSTYLIITRVGAIDTVKCLDSRRCKITIKKNTSLNTNKKLANSKVGKVLNVKTWKQLLGKLSLRMRKSSKSKTFYQKRFYLGKTKVKITDKDLTYKIKPNFILNPLVYQFYYVKGKCTPIAPRYREFQGLIWNKIGKAANDPRIWVILEEEPNGKENCRVYKSYKDFLDRKKKIRRMNTMIKYKYKLCKQCRKIKLLSTNKISGCINSYDIPYQYKQGVAKFFKELVKKWYKMRSKNVKITLPKGKKFNKKGDIVKDTKNPNKKHIYHCSTKPFDGFKFEKRAEGKGLEKQVSYGCAHYVAKSKKWKRECLIATIKPDQIPKHRSKIYLTKLVYQPPGPGSKVFYLKRGFKANKKGKKTTAYKKYKKWLEKMVAKKKKSYARCKNCKKKELASRKEKIVTWGAARFPVQVMSRKEMKNIPMLLNVSEKKGGFKCKKVNKKGCKKPKFIWTKVTIKTKVKVKGKTVTKNKPYAKLKCKNAKIEPKKLYVTSGYQGIYYAPSSKVKSSKAKNRSTGLNPTVLTPAQVKALAKGGTVSNKNKKK